MKRTEYRATVINLDDPTGQPIGETIKYAHKSAGEAGLSIVRTAARSAGILFHRGATTWETPDGKRPPVGVTAAVSTIWEGTDGSRLSVRVERLG